MILSQRQFLDRLSAHPNSFFYAVLWNKLYRRDVILRNAIRCDRRLPWGEDFASTPSTTDGSAMWRCWASLCMTM